MDFLDWVGLGIAILTVIGMQFGPRDVNTEAQRPAANQIRAAQPSQAAGIAIGGRQVLQLADSGTEQAGDRAIAVREALDDAIQRYDLPRRYAGLWLRVGGSRDLAEVDYLDTRLATVSAADARLNGAASPQALAARWRDALDQALGRLPSPLPEGWIQATGQLAAPATVTDQTLAMAASEGLGEAPGQNVRISAEGGMLVAEGQVGSERQHRALLRYLQAVPGCRGVVDRLSVTTP